MPTYNLEATALEQHIKYATIHNFYNIANLYFLLDNIAQRGVSICKINDVCFITRTGLLMMLIVVLICGFFGILLMGYDGALYPCPNIVGAILFFGTALVCLAMKRCSWEILGLLARMEKRNKK